MMKYLDRARQSLNRYRGYQPAIVGGVPLRCDPYHSWYWKEVSRGHWEPETFEVFERYAKPGRSICDIGAWIGPTVLFASSLGASVTCFEPDPYAFEHLRCNLRLNHLVEKVRAMQFALGKENGTRRMASFFKGLGDSTASLLEVVRNNSQAVDVPCLNWETALAILGSPAFDFMKIDIEGGEFELLPCLASYFQEVRPDVFLSTHAPYLPENERLEKMQLLSETISKWATLHRYDGTALPTSELLSTESLNTFRSFLLLPIRPRD